ncbi:hypothetical protein [Campylobacter geochelonis]|uniref:Uncharacterized protein n=1 Tax=Campylobacter geochelonis TaxID=1780362 RepID=A0A128EKC2_9BACT|nr:hypothetical protein [Campylobacter geochelonis]QKF71490.1 hypothetical protein CGEO_1192 [Campylobacter geochelonis]CZE49334.1 Uncharacterised protein [Campylobacter geochelonis]
MKFIYKLLLFLFILSFLYYNTYLSEQDRLSIKNKYNPFLHDAIVFKNCLDKKFSSDLRIIDKYTMPPKFYFIEENPTVYEIIKALQYIMDDKYSPKIDISIKEYKNTQNVTIQRKFITTTIELFDVLNDFYTVVASTKDIIKFKDDKGHIVPIYAELPLNQAFIIIDTERNIKIYGIDSFLYNKKNIYIKEINLKDKYYNMESYVIKNADKKLSFKSTDFDDFNRSINAYIKKMGIGEKHILKFLKEYKYECR